MKEFTDMQSLRQVLEPAARAAETPGCLTRDAIAAFAEGALTAAARDAVLPHLAGCARCRGAVASVTRALSDPDVARAAAVGRKGNTWQKWLAIAGAAAALLLLVRPSSDPPQTTHRAPTIAAAPAPVPVSPTGTTASAASLVWRSVSGADRYRLTLFDEQGQVLYERQLADTVAALPDSLNLKGNRTYLWKVDARLGFDRWVSSVLVRFSLESGAR